MPPICATGSSLAIDEEVTRMGFIHAHARMLLGHHSIKMTEKHYLPWVKARQDQLTASIRRAWFTEVWREPSQAGGNDVAEAEAEGSFRLLPGRCHSVEVHGCSNPRRTRPFFLYL